MSNVESNRENGERPLRLWPGVLIVALAWAARLVGPRFGPEAEMWALLGAFLGAVLVLVWWVLLSRASWQERLGGALLLIVALPATAPFLDESVATAGQGFLFPILAAPVLALAFVVWAVASRRLSVGARRATMLATVLLAAAGWTLVRTEGVSATGSHWAWRWSMTAEERLLARGEESPSPLAPTVSGATAAAVEADWPGFRGASRDGVARGARIATDWSASPPVEIWRRPVGPGWSSFAVAGDLLYTQEQRGEEELVAAYRLSDGEPVWRHTDRTRFWESNAGAGPRGTPTWSAGRLYSFGATGILNALDAVDGREIWSRDVAADVGVAIPYWGFASSPLVVGDMVIVAASHTLAAYEIETGEPRWSGPSAAGGESYSSPHPMRLDGVEQVVLMNGGGALSVAPADGSVLWQHAWTGSIVQPALTAEGDVLIGALAAASGLGVRRLAVERGAGEWRVDERWTSTGLKPYFNDFVVHAGHAFGFDGSILACIDLDGGERRWKGGRYGQGQLVLLPDQDLLLVVSERGELALVAAVADGFSELARLPVLEGKTWNHPVLVNDLLLVRNDREMVALRLPPESS